MASSLGLESGTVRIVPYDPEWPLLFEAEARRLYSALAPLSIVLEHTGSTSVPGLAAKPVLDILGGVTEGESVEPYVVKLIRAGYVHRGDQGIPGREFFRRGEPRAYHLHLAHIRGAFWREHLAFRDYLRTHPEIRDEYAELKRTLAARFSFDRERYVEGKGAFVRRVIDLAIPRVQDD